MSAKSTGSMKAGHIVLNRIPQYIDTQTAPQRQAVGGKPVKTIYEQKFLILAPDEVIQAGDVYPVLLAGGFVQGIEVQSNDKVIGSPISTLAPGLWLRPVE
jgi:hypothetical protein